MTDIGETPAAVVFCASVGVGLSWICHSDDYEFTLDFTVTCAALGLISMFTSLRTPNSGK